MRILTLNLLAVALLVFGAASASAFAVNMSFRSGDGTGLSASDTVTVDVFMDADVSNINLFSISVINSNAAAISYDGAASAALAVIYPAPPPAYGTQGDQPGYVLYAPGAGGMPPTPSTALYPQQTPWQTWPAPAPGTEQVNINYAEINITDAFGTQTTGSNIWIASLVFHIDSAIGSESLALSLSSGGNIQELATGAAIGGITTSAPLALVPEPATAALIGLGLLGLAITGRRQL